MVYTYLQEIVLNPIVVKNVNLEQVEKYKYLGIILDSNMSYNSQFNKTVSSLNGKIWMLKHFRNFINEKTALIVMKAMILPYMDNSTIFLSGIRLFDQKRLQILQNIALRLCFNIRDPTEISVKELHTKANVLPLDLRRNYLQAITCYRLINIKALNLVTNRRTRAGDGPLIVNYLTHTKRVQISPANSAYDTWNSIPHPLRMIETISSFKGKYRTCIAKYFKLHWRYDLQFTTH